MDAPPLRRAFLAGADGVFHRISQKDRHIHDVKGITVLDLDVAFHPDAVLLRLDDVVA